MYRIRTRGRKIGSDGVKSKELLLKIAAEEFALHGYHTTKISTIVRKANVTQPTFYLYFKSKDAIFQELVDLFIMKLTTFTENSRLASGMDQQFVQGRIVNSLTSTFAFFAQDEYITRIGFVHSAKAIEIKEQMAKQIEKNLTEEVKDGYFHSEIDLSTVAEAIVGVIEHLTLTKLWTGLKTPDELADEIARLFLYGLSVR